MLSDTSDDEDNVVVADEPPKESHLLLAGDDVLTHIVSGAAETRTPADVVVAGFLLHTCKGLFWRVNYIAVTVEGFYWIPRRAMVFNLYWVLSIGWSMGHPRFAPERHPAWSPCSMAAVQAAIADRVVELASAAEEQQDVRHAASRIVHRVRRRLCAPVSPAVCARMDAVRPECVLPGPFL